MRKKQTNRQKIFICLLVFLMLVVYICFIKSASIFRQVTTKKTQLKERTELDINSWFDDIYATCEGNVVAYGHEFFILKNVRLEQTNSLLFAVPCRSVDSKPYFFYSGYEGTPMTEWMLSITRRKDSEELIKVEYTFTVAIKRTEAHNIYHTLTEWFNIFVLSKHFKFNPQKVDVIFLDDRPPGAMDETWHTLYRRVYYAKNLPEPTVFKTLILSPIGYESPLRLPFLKKVEGIEEFSDYFLQGFGINERKKLNCARLRVVIIWRHDYNSHPERAEAGGTIFRKIQNEAEVLQQLKDSLPGHEIIDILLENMGMKQQLQLMAHTDVLIGMHGAGNAHALFLPSHAVLLELFPLDSPYDKIQYFRAFCLWRNLTYVSWQNEDKNNDLPNYYTFVPPTVIDTYIKSIYKGLCS
ncbi:hypothetical protein CHS0354_018009 [Potamilus streckersoni]|uniref:Glycosyltransferase 61 catalytic domain-containing protein n=1 Tax=Potamilus streckersoni TaxID=2493646 RepID=A0AAE0SU94_9BIVA|nr:hypothetical protein CHS0354_018009 [Potamilus streckersoni]